MGPHTWLNALCPVLNAASQEGRPWLLCTIRLKVTSPPVQLQPIYCVLLPESGSPRTTLTQAHAVTPVAPGGAPSHSAQTALGPGLSTHGGGRNRERVTVTQSILPIHLFLPARSCFFHRCTTPCTKLEQEGYTPTAGLCCDFVGACPSVGSARHFLPVLTDLSLPHGPGRASGSLSGNPELWH